MPVTSISVRPVDNGYIVSVYKETENDGETEYDTEEKVFTEDDRADMIDFLLTSVNSV